MKNLVLSMIALAGLTAACGSSYPMPTDRLAASEAAIEVRRSSAHKTTRKRRFT